MYKLISRLYKYIINNIFDSYTHSDLYFGSVHSLSCSHLKAINHFKNWHLKKFVD